MVDGQMVPQGPITAADGTPLKKKLAQALFRSRVRAVSLVVPLLAFVMASFVIPIFALMWQGVYNDRFSTYTPNLTEQLSKWDGLGEPDETLFVALVADLKKARKDRTIGRIATRVNQEYPGTRSLFTSTARKAKKLKAPFKKSIIKTNKKWANIEIWRAMKLTSQDLTPSFYATALDGRYTVDKGFVKQNENRQIYVKLFWRTFMISATVMALCLLLGYPVAYLLATLPLRSSNLLMIMVLLPFWTSLLVRTTAWIAILQSQGVINDLMVAVGITADDSRFSLIYNMTGTIIAMTHILLPFMILPIHASLERVPNSLINASYDLGASKRQTFYKVILPLALPGIAAGSIFTFSLTLGDYIIPYIIGTSKFFIGQAVYTHQGVAGNIPLAAAFSLVPIAVMTIYIYVAKKLGAFNAL